MEKTKCLPQRTKLPKTTYYNSTNIDARLLIKTIDKPLITSFVVSMNFQPSFILPVLLHCSIITIAKQHKNIIIFFNFLKPEFVKLRILRTCYNVSQISIVEEDCISKIKYHTCADLVFPQKLFLYFFDTNFCKLHSNLRTTVFSFFTVQ